MTTLTTPRVQKHAARSATSTAPKPSSLPVTPRVSAWPARWASLLCLATFPLVWVGGLITTTDAGMAVPDWPGTYGYNLFLYPWQTWMFGPWDLFIEHGHRLLASGVGLVTIALAVAVWRSPAHRSLRWPAVAALALVIGQGVLGGMRVVLNERTLAMAHGSTGPLFFAVTVALLIAVVRRTKLARSQAGATPAASPAAMPDGAVSRLAWGLPALCYVQLLLGATIRHVPEASGFGTFAYHVQAHVWGAVVVLLAVLTAAGHTLLRGKTNGADAKTRHLVAAALTAVVVAQASLGVATWVAKYRLPAFAQSGPIANAWAVVGGPTTMRASTAGGWAETHTVSAHHATGTLLLGLAVAWAMAVRSAPRSTQRRITADTNPPVLGANPAPEQPASDWPAHA